MSFSVSLLEFPDTDSTFEGRILRTEDGSVAVAEMIRNVERGQSFLLAGAPGSGKNVLLNEVSSHFNSGVGDVVAFGPLSLNRLAHDGLDTFGSQLRDWLNLVPNTLSSSEQPPDSDSLDVWLPFLNKLASDRKAKTLLLLFDDQENVPPEYRALLQAIQNSPWADITTRMVLGCAVISAENDRASYMDEDSPKGSETGSPVAAILKRETAMDLVSAIITSLDTPGPVTDSTAVNLKRETLLDLVNALISSLGSVQDSMKKGDKPKGGGGKGGKGKYSLDGDEYEAIERAAEENASAEARTKETLGKGDPPGKVLEDVDATVYAPFQASPGDSVLVLVYAHLPAQAGAVEEEAKAVAPDSKKRVARTLDQQIKRGAKLTFNLTMPEMEIDEPSQSLIWRGKQQSVQFGVTVPKDARAKTLVGTIIVSESSVPIGHLKFTLRIVSDNAGASSSSESVPAGSLIRYKRAFISYASPDRSEVLKRVQMLKASKVDFFQDLLTLEPGDHWEELIYQYIDQCDVVFLFWSKAASKSRWVKKEITYAIERKAGNDNAAPEILPVIIEGPPPAKPPKKLAFLHFNDKFMYFIKGEEGQR